MLPFLLDVQSPIVREQYERLIAKRLGVSESAIAEARAKLARAVPTPTTPEQKPFDKKMHERAAQTFGVLLWQESLAKPALDTEKLAVDLEAAIGAEELAALRAKPEGEQESLRFSAERLHGTSDALARASQGRGIGE